MGNFFVGFQQFQYFPAVHFRHEDVQDDHVEVLFEGFLQAFLARHGRMDHVAVAGQLVLQDVVHRLIVVNQQQLGLLQWLVELPRRGTLMANRLPLVGEFARKQRSGGTACVGPLQAKQRQEKFK